MYCAVEGLKKRKRKRKEKDPERRMDSDPPGSSGKEASLDWWDKFCKRIRGCDSPDNFKTFFRMSRTTFDYICTFMKKEDQTSKCKALSFNDGTSLSIQDQVAIALTRLGSGESLVTVGDTTGVTPTTVAQATWRFVRAMEDRALHHLQWPAESRKIKRSFLKLTGLPNCCGAVDTTHILMKLRGTDTVGQYCLDRQKNHSLVLQTVVDHKMRFIDVVAGWPGQMSEASVFQSSNFYTLCNQGKRLDGRKLKFEVTEGSKLKIRQYIVGGSKFPLLPYLITPYSEGLEPEFYRAHCKAVMVAKRALGRLKGRWRIIGGVMWRPDRHKLSRIILVCCLLHNILIDMEDEVAVEKEKMDGNGCSWEHDPGYREQVSEIRDDVKGAMLRAKLSLYLSAKFQES